MGSVRRSPRSGLWEVRYRDASGRQRTRRRDGAGRAFADKADARAYLATVEADMHRGHWIDPSAGRVTYAEWSEQYFGTALHKRATTLARDRTVNDKHFLPAFGTRSLGAITPLDVRGVVERMAGRLAPATVRTNYGVLRAILSAAVDAELITATPCRGVRLPADDKDRRRFLSAEQLELLAGEMPVEYRPMVYLAGVLALRWSEIAGLRVGRIDFLRSTLEVAETCAEVGGRVAFAPPKTRASRRTLSVPAFLVAMLAEHLAHRGRPDADALVFVAPEGGPLRRSTFRTRVFDPAVTRAGVAPLTFHGLRHTAAGLMVETGAHIEAIKHRLGHSSIRVTSDVYGSLLPTVDESVTAALEARFASARGARVVHDRAGRPDS